MAPKDRKDSSLGKILALVIVVPLVLIVLLVIAFSAYGAQPTAHSSAATIWEYGEFQEASGGTAAGAWLKACDSDVSQAYVLRFREKDPGNGIARYLVYVPGAKGSVSFGMSSGKTLWRSYNSLDITGDQDGEPLIFWIVTDSEKPLPLDVYLNGEKLKTVLTETDSYPVPEALWQDVDDVDFE